MCIRDRNEIYPKLERNCEALTKAVADSALDHNVDAQVNKVASMFQLFFASNPVVDYVSAKSSDTQKFTVYFNELLKQGVFVPPSQFETCFLSTAHSKDDLERTVEAIDSALRKVSSGGCSGQ